MNKVNDLIALSVLAFKQRQYDNAAKLFVAAMESDGLDQFVAEIAELPPGAALHGTVPVGENTIAPSIESLSSDELDIEDVVAYIEQRFRSECSYIEDGDEEVETRAADDSDSEELEGRGSDFEIVAAAGPVRLK